MDRRGAPIALSTARGHSRGPSRQQAPRRPESLKVVYRFSRECSQTRYLASYYQGVDAVDALVGVDGLHVGPVARHVVLVEDAVAALYVPRLGDYAASLA